MTCLACGKDNDLVRHFDDGGYCAACNPTNDQWADERAEIAIADMDNRMEMRAEMLKLRRALVRSTDYLGHLLDHLPEDKRDNSVWLECRSALGRDASASAQ